MRVGLVIYGGIDFSSGGFLYDRMLVEALRQAGDEVEIISLPWESFGRCLAHNFAPWIRSRLRAWKGDLLLQDELVHPSVFLQNKAIRRARGVPLVSIVHHLAASERPGAGGGGLPLAVERAYLRSVDGFVFNAEVTRQAVLALCGSRCPGVVAHPGGDRMDSSMTCAEIQNRAAVRPLRVLFVGNLVPRKGLLTLLEALAMQVDGQCQLSVAGSRAVDPSYTRQVEKFVRERGLEDRVVMRDRLDDAQLAAEMRAHHVLAVPSVYEGFGIVYLEAMGFGMVPVGSAAGGAAEIIEQGANGFLVPPGDVGALAGIIGRLAADRALLASCARAARQRFLRFTGWGPQMAGVRDWLHTFVGHTGN